MPGASDFAELLAVLDLRQADENTFFGVHPSKNPIRTFGGQMMAQAFVAAGRTVTPGLPASALSVHFIAGGDPARDLEFQVVRLRDERRFANRRVDVVQGDQLLATALVSYLSGGRGLEHPTAELDEQSTVAGVGSEAQRAFVALVGGEQHGQHVEVCRQLMTQIARGCCGALLEIGDDQQHADGGEAKREAERHHPRRNGG